SARRTEQVHSVTFPLLTRRGKRSCGLLGACERTGEHCEDDLDRALLISYQPRLTLNAWDCLGALVFSANASVALRRGAIERRRRLQDEGWSARRGPCGHHAKWAEVFRRKVRGVGRMPMPPRGGRIGAGGAPAPDGTVGPVEGPNRVAFPAEEGFEPSIEG